MFDFQQTVYPSLVVRGFVKIIYNSSSSGNFEIYETQLRA